MVAAQPILRTDLVAGLTVAMVGLPQCIAYALMSGLPPAYGLSTAAVAGLVAALVGRSTQVVTGPTNTTGLLILSALLPFIASNGLLHPDAVRVLATLTLLVGAIRVLGALAGGAHMIRLIPDSVLIGFTAGAAILIGVMQLDEALGLKPARATSFFSQMGEILPHLSDVRWPAIVVTVTTIAILFVGMHRFSRVPIGLFVIIAAALMAWLLRLNQKSGLPLVGDRGALPNTWPPLAIPDPSVGLMQSLFVPALAIVLLGTLELAVTARAGGQRPDMRREIFAQGWANTAGAFLGAMPASASLSRSALLTLSDARTRLAAATAAVASGAILIAGGSLAAFIPQASLAATLLVIAVRMIDWHGIRRLWNASRETRLLFVETFAATLFLPLSWAILLGTGTALVIHIANTSAPRLRVLRPEGDHLVPVGADDQPDVVVIEVSGNLHYAAVAPFVDEAEKIIPSSARAVVIDLSHAHEIRFAALRALEGLAEEMQHDGGVLWLAGVQPDTAALLERSGTTIPWVAEEPAPGRSVRKCIAKVLETQTDSGGSSHSSPA